jgi:hypothetical protein
MSQEQTTQLMRLILGRDPLPGERLEIVKVESQA